MADIDKYLANIKKAIYGEEVRGSIHDAIDAINNVADEALDAAKNGKDSAAASAAAALASQNAAKTSETNAANSATAAKNSQNAAKTSENNASTYANNANSSATSASTSATNAANSASAAKTSETNAADSAAAALISQNAAATSETNAKVSEDNAKASENSTANMKADMESLDQEFQTDKAEAKQAIDDVRDDAITSVTNIANAAKTDIQQLNKESSDMKDEVTSMKADVTDMKADVEELLAQTQTSEANAAASAAAAKTSETNAKTSETNAKTSETNAANTYSDILATKKEFDEDVATSKTEINDIVTTAKSDLNTLVSNSETEIADITTTAKNDISTLTTQFNSDAQAATNRVNSAATTGVNNINKAVTDNETTLKGYVNSASTSATNAANSASAAKTSETNAASSASTAKTEADRAKTEADRAEAIVGQDTMKGATATADGHGGLMIAPKAGENTKYFRGDGTYNTIAASEVQLTDGTTLQTYVDGDKTSGTSLANQISTEVSTRAKETSTLTTDLNSEITNRQNADKSLQDQITANDTDITNLQSADATEASTRATAVTNLQTQITANANKFASYLPLAGGTMNGTAKISWPDSGNWSNSNKNVTFPIKRGGLSWSGQSDGIELYAEETANDNLDLVLKFTDDNSNGLSIRNASGTQTARIKADGSYTGKAATAGTADKAGNVTGVVAIANGGTGNTTAADAANYLINNGLTTGTSDPQDADYYLTQYAGGGTTTTTYHRRPHSALWNYIKGKISSILGLTKDNYGGKAANATTAGKTSFKGAHAETASGNTANAPTAGVADGQGLYLTGTYNDSATPVSYGNIINAIGAGSGQLLLEWSGSDNTTGGVWYRSHRDTSSGGWGAWKKLAKSDDLASYVPTSRKVNGHALTGDVTVTKSDVGLGNVANSAALPLAGGTMTGQLKTSFKESVAVGSYQVTATTLPNILTELRYSSGCMGSVNLTTASNGIPTGWYNFFYAPHRSGGANGQASGDNCNYGTLLLFGMTVANQAWVVEYQSGAINNVYSIRNTWRGIQNNLTSTSTTDSLSAAQGKALNDKFASYVPLAGGTMTGNLNFSNSGTSTRQVHFTAGDNDYGRIAMGATASNAGWLEIASADDGNEPIYARQYTGDFTTVKRTATLLDGSGNTSFPGTVTAPNFNGQAASLTRVTVSSGNTGNYTYHRFAYISNITGQYSDTDSVFLIRQMFDGGAWGIIKVSMRTNSTNSAVSVNCRWLARSGFSADSVQFGRWGVTGNACYADIFVKMATYARAEVVRLSSGASSWAMCSSNEVNNTTTSDRLTSTNCYSSLSDAATQLHGGTAYTATGSASDVATVSYANSAGSATSVPWSGITNKNKYIQGVNDSGCINNITAGSGINAVFSVVQNVGVGVQQSYTNTCTISLARTLKTMTLSASSWSSGVYSLESSYPAASYDIEELQPNAATAAQLKAWAAAQCTGSATANTITATGTVPTIDIPVMFYATVT